MLECRCKAIGLAEVELVEADRVVVEKGAELLCLSPLGSQHEPLDSAKA